MIIQFLILFMFPVLLNDWKTSDLKQLFYSLKKQPVTRGNKIRIEQVLARKTMVHSERYPDINY